MGEYLSKPDKTKTTEYGENPQVSKFKVVKFLNRLDLLRLECKDGADRWKTHILLILILAMDCHFLEFLMGMGVSKYFEFLNHYRSGSGSLREKVLHEDINKFGKL